MHSATIYLFIRLADGTAGRPSLGWKSMGVPCRYFPIVLCIRKKSCRIHVPYVLYIRGYLTTCLPWAVCQLSSTRAHQGKGSQKDAFQPPSAGPHPVDGGDFRPRQPLYVQPSTSCPIDSTWGALGLSRQCQSSASVPLHVWRRWNFVLWSSSTADLIPLGPPVLNLRRLDDRTFFPFGCIQTGLGPDPGLILACAPRCSLSTFAPCRTPAALDSFWAVVLDCL